MDTIPITIKYDSEENEEEKEKAVLLLNTP